MNESIMEISYFLVLLLFENCYMLQVEGVSFYDNRILSKHCINIKKNRP